MRVRVEDIPPEGLEVAFSCARLKPGVMGPQVNRVMEPPRAELHLSRQGEMILARGTFQAVLELTCSRCLASVPYRVSGPLEMVFCPPPLPVEGEEMELSQEDMEVIFFQGEEIDLDQGLLEEVALGLPMAPLCSPECRGLCPGCGRPLAQGSCDCQDKGGDPRWAKLAQLNLE